MLADLPLTLLGAPIGNGETRVELEPENEEEEEEESGLMFLVYRGCITNDKIIL
jgi:hypothetical protein